jgi:hypothetical protein
VHRFVLYEPKRLLKMVCEDKNQRGSVDGKINCKEFGLKWHGATETGGLIIGDDVNIHGIFEFTKQV